MERQVELLLRHGEVFDLVTGGRKLPDELCESETADQDVLMRNKYKVALNMTFWLN